MHVLLAAPEFEPRPECQPLRAALKDPCQRVIALVGVRGAGKTALVREALAETQSAHFVWRFDLNPDIHDLLDGLSRHLNTQIDGLTGLGELTASFLLVIDGMQDDLHEQCGDVPPGYGLKDLLSAVRSGKGGARVLLVAEPGLVSGLCEAGEQIHLPLPTVQWRGRRLSSIGIRPESDLGLFAMGAPSVRVFEQVRAILNTMVPSKTEVPQWLRDCAENHDEVMQVVLTEAGPDVQAAAFTLAAVSPPLRAESVLQLRDEIEPLAWQAALDRLVQLRLLSCATAGNQTWYELDPAVPSALSKIESEAKGIHRLLLMMRQFSEQGLGAADPMTQLRASIEADDLVGAQRWYGALRTGLQMVAPNSSIAQLAGDLVCRWGIGFEQWENEQSPAFDRAVSYILRGNPRRAEAGLITLRAQIPREPICIAAGGWSQARAIALDESLIDAIVAQGDLGRAESAVEQALSGAVGPELSGLQLRRAWIKGLRGHPQATTQELAALMTIHRRLRRRRSGVAEICLAEQLCRLGRVQSAEAVLSGIPNEGLLRARADLVRADVMRARAEYEGAARLTQVVYDYAQEEGLVALRAQALISLSRISCAQRDLPQAVEQANQAAEITGRLGYSLEYIDALICGARAGDNSIDLSAVLTLARACDYAWAVSAGLQLSAERAVGRGEGALATRLAEEALQLRRDMQDPKLANTRVALKAALSLSGRNEGV